MNHCKFLKCYWAEVMSLNVLRLTSSFAFLFTALSTPYLNLRILFQGLDLPLASDFLSLKTLLM